MKTFGKAGDAGRTAIVLSALLIFAQPAANAPAAEYPENNTENRADTTENRSAGKTEDTQENGRINAPDDLPSCYNVCDEGRQPAVESQGEYETCWAFTALSAIESRLMPRQQLRFSADHMSLNNAFTADVQDGGDYRMIMAYLAGWQGPVLEEEDPYGDGVTVDGLTPAVHVQEIRYLKGKSTEEIKQEIYTYGPIQTSLYMSRATTEEGSGYYNPETFSYYCPDEFKVIHDALVLGWDDHFSRNNFKIEPPGDGAFICQNTWGTDFGDGGIYYLSYYDANAAQGGLAFSSIQTKDNYDMIYQTDPCGWQKSVGMGSETCVISNVYTAKSDQMLKAAGFYAVRPDTEYEVYIFPEDQIGGLPSLSAWIPAGSGVLADAGYYTVRLDRSLAVKQGTEFAAAVRLTSPGTSKPAAVETKHDIYTQNVTTDGKRGYISKDGEIWLSAEENFDANICLKVYAAQE